MRREYHVDLCRRFTGYSITHGSSSAYGKALRDRPSTFCRSFEAAISAATLGFLTIIASKELCCSSVE